MNSAVRELGHLLASAFRGWKEDNAAKLGAALAYYTVFSLAPVLVIALAIGGWVFGPEAAEQGLDSQLHELLGAEAAQAVQSLLASARQPAAGLSAASLGIVALLLGASGVFGELQDSLNIVWKARPPAGGGLWSYVRTRFLSFAMVLGVGFLLLVSLVISAVLSGMTHWWAGHGQPGGLGLQVVNAAASLAVITLLFAMIFKFLPDAHVAWRDVGWGAFATALLFTLGKQLIGAYLGRASIASAYGAAGSVILVLLWTYYSAQILFFGAEFTRASALRAGRAPQPP